MSVKKDLHASIEDLKLAAVEFYVSIINNFVQLIIIELNLNDFCYFQNFKFLFFRNLVGNFCILVVAAF